MNYNHYEQKFEGANPYEQKYEVALYCFNWNRRQQSTQTITQARLKVDQRHQFARRLSSKTLKELSPLTAWKRAI